MNKKRIATMVMVGAITMTMTGCVKPYNAPEFVEITPSQTAFLIPMVGDSTEQVKLDSEEMLQENLVSSKRIQIPKTWVQTGRMEWMGEYMPSANLIVVDRKAVTREWTETAGEGTSNANQGIVAESSESIGFMARMYVTAQIQESDSVKFLYNYNGKQLETIIDSDIRAKIEGTFNEVCSKRTIDQIRVEKEEIMNEVRNIVIPYFKEKGITVNSISLKGELTYLNAEIQKSIDAKFKAQKEKEAQAEINEKNIAQAQAEQEAIKIQSSTLDDTIKIKQAEAEVIKAQAELEKAKAMANWQVSTIGGTPIINSK